MSVAGIASNSWRLERVEVSRLTWAFAISIALHLFLFGGYSLGNRLHLWEKLHWPAWLQPIKTLVEKFVTKQNPPPAFLAEKEVPLVFVDVSPAQATAEAPKNATYYSDKNSLAGNPTANKDSNIPKITGLQKDIPKTEDVPRDKYTPLQPAPPPEPLPPAEQAKLQQPELKAKATEAPGDLTMAKPDPIPKTENGDAPHQRPRTLEEARLMRHETRPPGPQMQQEGGVRRRFDFSLDTLATPFGAYDAALIDAVRQCWYDLLEHQKYSADYNGRVVLQFDLHYDGRITGLRIANNTAGEIPGWLCQTAVDKPSPYAKFPPDMRRNIGDVRFIQFTFFYY